MVSNRKHTSQKGLGFKPGPSFIIPLALALFIFHPAAWYTAHAGEPANFAAYLINYFLFSMIHFDPYKKTTVHPNIARLSTNGKGYRL